MFYFCSKVATEIDRLDLEQLKQVQLFKQRVFKDGLAKEYSTVKSFEEMMREHLTLEARAVLKQYTDDAKSSPKKGRKPTPLPKPQQSAKQVRSGKGKAASTSQPSDTGAKIRPKLEVSPGCSEKAASRPKLEIPKVAKELTDANREKFARKALRRTLDEFRNAAKAFNAEHPHATIAVKQDGKNAFTIQGEDRNSASQGLYVC